MGFLDNLRQEQLAPVDSQQPIQGVAGMNSGGNINLADVLSSVEPFINRMRNRNIEDMRAQRQIEAQTPNFQDGRIRQIANPESMNVRYDPGITDFQKANLAQGQQEIDLNKAKFGESKKSGDEKLALQQERLKLDTDKNSNIYETKQKELEQKSHDAEAKLELAKQAMQGRENNAMMQDQYHRAQIDATNARHQLDLARRDREIQNTKDMNEARIKQIHDAADQAGFTIQEVTASEPDSSGNPTKKTIITKKGGQDTSRVAVIGPKGETGTVSAEEAKSLPAGWKKK